MTIEELRQEYNEWWLENRCAISMWDADSTGVHASCSECGSRYADCYVKWLERRLTQ